MAAPGVRIVRLGGNGPLIRECAPSPFPPENRPATRIIMSLMMETTFEVIALECLTNYECPTRRCVHGAVVERLAGERGDILAWLTTRAEAFCHEGCVVQRVRYRQRRRVWAARIAYYTAPTLE
jgi:hypothetical protein